MGIPICSKCDKAILNDAAFCPECGASAAVNEYEQTERTSSNLSNNIRKPKFRGLQRFFAAYLIPWTIIYLLTEELKFPEIFIAKVAICLIALMAYCWCVTYKMKSIYEKPTTALIQLMIAFICMQFAYYSYRSDANLSIITNGINGTISNMLSLLNLQQTVTVAMIIVFLICCVYEWYRIDSTAPDTGGSVNQSEQRK
jgi:hypothetical protein